MELYLLVEDELRPGAQCKDWMFGLKDVGLVSNSKEWRGGGRKMCDRKFEYNFLVQILRKLIFTDRRGNLFC